MRDVSSWTDQELDAEIAAWSDGGDQARLPAQWAYLALGERGRRRPKTDHPTGDELKRSFRDMDAVFSAVC